MGILDEIRTALTSARWESRRGHLFILIGNREADELLKLSSDEVGSELAREIILNGLDAFSSLYGATVRLRNQPALLQVVPAENYRPEED